MNCFGENAKINVNRYNPNGMTQNNGRPPISVVINVVTPIDKLHGINDRTIHVQICFCETDVFDVVSFFTATVFALCFQAKAQDIAINAMANA